MQNLQGTQKEPERKFLLIRKPSAGDVFATTQIKQGYLLPEGKVTKRVRIEENMLGERTAFFALKDHEKGKKHLGEDEKDDPIPLYMAERLMKECGDCVLKKIRYDVIYGHGDTRLKWEVDVFKKNLKGLYVAEIELTTPTQKIIVPEWLGKEVTKNKQFKNKQLAMTQCLPDDYKKPKAVKK